MPRKPLNKKKKGSGNPRPHYWICDACAARQGGVVPEGACSTVCYGTCHYCNTGTVTLVPIVDFRWPGGPSPVFD